MKKLALTFAAMLAFVVLVQTTAQACTTFCLFHGKDLIFGRNYDFPIGYGHVIINKRGVMRTATANEGEVAAQWLSKYGSLTFNQFGRDLPTGGMNETGLIVELSQLDATRYPNADSRPALGSLEWIQYQLDNAATVQEVMQLAEKVRIRSHVGIHFLITDSKGEIASVEFLNGKLVAHSGDKMPMKSLANSTYEEALAYAKRFESIASLPNSMSSLDRFVRAGVMAKNYKANAGKSAIDYAFDILRNLTVHFFTSKAQRVRHVRLKSFDFNCASPVKILEVNADLTGDVAAHFNDYSHAANRALVFASFQNSPFTKQVPASALEEIAKHPERSACREIAVEAAKTATNK